MSNYYFRLYENLLKEVDNLTQAVVLCKILNYAESTKTTRPTFQQTYLSSILNLSTDTVGRALDGLSEKGFLDFKAKGYGADRTTTYYITDKTYSLIKGRDTHKPETYLSEEPSEEVLKLIASAEDRESAKRIADEHGVKLTPQIVETINKLKNNII